MNAEQQINSLLARSTGYAARIEGEFTREALVKAIDGYQRNGRKVNTLLLCAEHTIQMNTSAEFNDFLDPVTSHAILATGQIGTLLGVTVYSEAALPKEKHMLRGVSYLYP